MIRIVPDRGERRIIVERRILETAALSLIKMRNAFKDPNVVINEIAFEVEGNRFYAEKFLKFFFPQ